jgi:probable HAF family extracellular repeat protein
MTRLAALWLSAVTPALLLAQESYTITDLGLPPGQTSVSAPYVAEDGTVIVYAFPQGGGTRSYLWKDGQFTDLGLFNPGLLRNEASEVIAEDVVVGSSWSTNGFPARAWRWEDGVYTQLPTLGGPHAAAFSVSPAGHITGWADVSQAEAAGFYFFNAFLLPPEGPIQNMGEVAGSRLSSGVAVDAEGRVAASATTRAGSWARGAIASTSEGMQEIAALGSARAYANDMNELGHIVGSADVAASDSGDENLNVMHAFLWREGVTTDLGSLPGYPMSFGLSVNVHDTCVGVARITSNNPEPRAVRFKDGQADNLNDMVPPESGYTLRIATSINDAGQILVRARLNGQDRVVLLTPAP